MEIKFKNLTYRNILKDVCLNFYSSNVYGIVGIDYSVFYSLITKKSKLFKGKIIYSNFKPSFSIIDSKYIHFYTSTVKSEINYYCKNNKVYDKKFINKIESRFKLFDLDILDKKISMLSSSEIFMFYFLLNTLFEKNIYLFNNVFKYVDRNNKKLIIKYLDLLKEKNCFIFLFDNDVNILYNYTNKSVAFNNGQLIYDGETDDLYTDVELLLDNNLSIPFSSEITYYAKKKKNVKLFYSKDVRDIMKDIYKHV